MTFGEALLIALAEVKDECAQAYLQAIEYGSEGLKVQIMYCLSNMQYYKGKTARAVKKTFKAEVERLR